MTNPKLRFVREDGSAFPDWVCEKLEDITCEVASGRSAKQSVGMYPLYGATGIIGRADTFDCDGEGILVARVGSVGTVNFCVGRFAVSDNAILVRTKQNLSAYFLFCQLKRFDWKSLASGTSQPVVAAKKLKNCVVAIGCEKEQAKITQFFSVFDEKISLAERKLTALQTLKTGFMQKIFSQEIRFKREDGSSFFDWQEKTIADIGVATTGMTPLTKEKSYYGGEYLFCGPADLNEQKYVSSSVKKLTRIGLDVAKKIPAGAILITCIGSTIGKMGIAAREMATNQQINSLVVSDDMDNEFVFYAIKHNFHKFIGEIGKQAVPILSKGKLERQKLLVACKEEQQIIGCFLKEIDNKIFLQQRMLQAMKQQKQAFMQQMFV